MFVNKQSIDFEAEMNPVIFSREWWKQQNKLTAYLWDPIITFGARLVKVQKNEMK